jgi:hypothetical protein
MVPGSPFGNTRQTLSQEGGLTSSPGSFSFADAPTGDQPPTPSASLTVPRDFVADLCGDVRGGMESIAGAF